VADKKLREMGMFLAVALGVICAPYIMIQFAPLTAVLREVLAQ
jgi:hypothetical protein